MLANGAGVGDGTFALRFSLASPLAFESSGGFDRKPPHALLKWFFFLVARMQ